MRPRVKEIDVNILYKLRRNMYVAKERTKEMLILIYIELRIKTEVAKVLLDLSIKLRI
jgi:hypothetical protein